MTLGEILKKARRDRSYREMERITGISHVYYITLEKGVDPRNGKSPTPSIETLQTLSKTLNIDFGQLLESVGVQLIKELREENKHLREALEFYADDKSWEFDWLDDIRESLIWQDYGEKARKALEG